MTEASSSPMADDQERMEVHDASELRAWLAEHGDRSASVWLIRWKKHAPDKYLAFEDMVRVLLCYGWIDGQVKSLDGDRLEQRISPRRKGSNWSAVNKRLVAELEASGAMTDAGRAVIERAKRDGSWTFLDDIEALVVPPDLQEALDADPVAEAAWSDYPKSEKKQALYALKSAKRPATRAKRLGSIVDNARAGRRSFT